MDAVEDRRWMARAIRLAARGLETTTPNPRVGCVIVRDGVALAEGWHERAGGPHAEAAALAAARVPLAGATAYVSLEPCSHHGRTPPCADALVRAGIARVVAAGLDPDPRVRGRGMARLSSAGVATHAGLLEAEAAELNRGYLRRIAGGRPWLRCKLAMSLDGRTAMASGESRWITGDAARRDVQRLRARSCAILTGAGTVRADDPRLDVRTPQARQATPPRQPLRVVLAGREPLEATARVFAPPGHALVLRRGADAGLATALAGRGVEVMTLPGDADGAVDPVAVIAELAARQCNEVLLESGPTLAGAFARAGLIDEYVIYMAPVLLGSRARALLELPFERMAERLGLHVVDVSAVGGDWRISAVPRGG
jgi:diaminohydroxyphosphoribosylaminopyrimidine deaminase/5-amino-6-(5-phosphoribosylamino)uracil reductase